MVGIKTSGRSLTGSAMYPNTPKITSATIRSVVMIGYSIKRREIFMTCPCRRGPCGPLFSGRRRSARSRNRSRRSRRGHSLLTIVHHHLIARLQVALNSDIPGIVEQNIDRNLLRFAVERDGIDILAVGPGGERLMRNERGMGNIGDGWKLMQQNDKFNANGCAGHSYGAVRLSGIGTVSLRGRARFAGTPKTCEVFRKGDRWYLSVTFQVTAEAVARTGGTESMAFDWGLNTLLTQVIGDPMIGASESVDNPRWLKVQLEKIAAVQKGISALEEQAKRQSGKVGGFPVCPALRRATSACGPSMARWLASARTFTTSSAPPWCGNTA